ncbi:TraB/GumN family protein [Chthonobacter albigriseus]|uniref:TraB/GumN family protein n=1 Tax=Chthonobacter albigriseus TaxID=1683161 RepID=UPI0015EEF2A5|nr:TraB/GumN family protein [Chthonobacter albigriseus]
MVHEGPAASPSAPAVRRPPRIAAGSLRASLAAVALAAAPLPATAEPALWALRDADSTIYLFGTFHIVKPEADWLTPRVAEAIKESGSIWMEVNLLDEAGSLTVALATLGTSPDRPLSARLSPEDLARVRAAADKVGLPFATLEPLRPWLAAMTISQKIMKDAGFSEAGPDVQLALMASQSRTPVRAFESAREQLEIFSNLSPEAEIAVLQSTLDTIDAGPAIMESMYLSWLTGDTEAIDREVLEQFRDMGPEVYARMLTERNRRFADRIRQILDGSGTQFVAVGAAHLIGDGSVQSFLAEHGIETERLDLGLKP